VKAILTAVLLFSTLTLQAQVAALVPRPDSDWWTVAGDPDLGKFTTPKQQLVDFAIWPAEDRTWQIWSCIRDTNCGGGNRLFYRWEGARIAMQADASAGETPGGLEAPYVIKTGKEYHMFYGDGENICLAKGADGKTFARQLLANGKAGMFTEGPGSGTRGVMVLRIGDLYHAYYAASVDKLGKDYVRTSRDLKNWSASRVVAGGGTAGSGPSSAEGPFVYYHRASKYYYLFRTTRYSDAPQTYVYASKNPMDFGANNDDYMVGILAVAAPELIEHEGQLYMAALLPNLKGIRIAKVKWSTK
jgi:hypothetical protein